jgi:hypothetical protein
MAWSPRSDFDTSGFSMVGSGITKWDEGVSLTDLKKIWDKPGFRAAAEIQASLASAVTADKLIRPVMAMSMFLSYEGQAKQAYQSLTRLRTLVEKDPVVARQWLYSIIYFQGVLALRQGENDNCIACRGESSCILPLNPAAVHRNDWGSGTAISHFHEYLERFPDDRHVQWLLNLATMTLGKFPEKVPERFLISLEHWGAASPVGAFRDISAETGLDRVNQSGGGIVDDFDNDGLLDVVVTSINPGDEMAFYRNRGDGRFTEVGSSATDSTQLGGLYCVQVDFDNDGFTDIFIPRGAWFVSAIRPTLLRNLGDGTFLDVTVESGLCDPVNSNSASWADIDNDGDPDLLICCERQQNRLYRNQGNGQFLRDFTWTPDTDLRFCKGASWIDYDNDGWQDLFLNNLQARSQLLRNNNGQTFVDVTESVGISGPDHGFACWTWDYNNDGWLDIFATSYERDIPEVLKGMCQPPDRALSSRLWKNSGGGRFEDQSVESQVAAVFETMGCNFGDIDNDGWLDFYLGTGDPEISTLIPNRLFHNQSGKCFKEITGDSRTGSLQKGHSVAFADWDRSGTQDIFIEMGGAIPGDRYHNILFQNRGIGNHWLTLVLRGTQACRSASGARIKVTTAGDTPQITYATVSSGSSFGANPLEVHLGLGRSTEIETLEIQWPGSGTRQSFHRIHSDQQLTVIEGRQELISTHVPVVSIPNP